MRSIKARFVKIKEKNPGLGHYIVFAQAVRGQKFCKGNISLQMSKLLIENEDYQRSDKKELLKQLHSASNSVEEHKK